MNNKGVRTGRIIFQTRTAFGMLAVMGVMLGGKVQAQTGPAIINISPNGAWQFQSSNTLTFNVTSSVGVAPGSIVVQLTATNLPGHGSSLSLSTTNGLIVTGSANNCSVSAPLTSNLVYTAAIQATDGNQNTTTTNISFDTIQPAYTFEAEDFDYGSGKFINNPQTNKYAGLYATNGIDAQNSNFSGGGSAYRPSGLNTEVNGDKPRLAYSTGLQDYDVGWNNGNSGNWGNYTRTFPAGAYNIYMRGANPNGLTADGASVSLVTSGRGTSTQTTTNLGTFSIPDTGNWQAYRWIPLLDANGNPVRFTGGSTETLRVSTDNGSYNANFYLLMPADTNQPVISNLYPNGSSFFQYTNVLSFTASCPVAITTNSISVTLDGTIASGLIFTGSPTNWSVSCPLAVNANHTVAITVTAENGNVASTAFSFNDFQAIYQLEAEDYDYTSGGVSGLFFDGQTGAYAGLGGTAHIDLYESDANAFGRGYSYRAANGADFPDMASQDQVRSQFTAAGKTDYAIGSFGTGSWANYTRHYPAGNYNVWGRFAEGQSATEATLSLLTGGYGTTSQTTNFLGTFLIPASGGWSTWEWGILQDGGGNPVQIRFDGSQQTLQLEGSPIGSQPEVNVNFLMLVPASTNSPVTGPVPAAYYPLNGDVLDYSGNGLNGVNEGATFVSPGYTTGVEAAQFNGTISSFVQIPRSVGVSSNGFTISMWVMTTQTAGSGPWYAGNGLVDGYLPGPQNAFGTSLDGTKFALGIGNPDTTVTSKATINDGNWHHVAATWNMTSGAMTVYVNGSLDSSGTGPTGPRTADSTLCIGRTPQNPNYFNGEIADVRLYNGVLTAQQIAGLASLQPVYPSVTTPTASPTNVVYAGYTITLNELAAGPPSPSYYQWMTNGVPIPGANSATLVLSNVTTAQSGNYSVIVSNSVGTNISPALAVTVNPASAPIFIMQPTPASQQVPVNGQTTITAAVDGSPPIALQWQFDGTNLPAQTQRSLVLSSVQTNESGSYTLVAANSFGTNTSQAATLTVVLPVSTVLVNVPTYHNDNQRSGANTNEVILTPNNVNTNTFGKLFTQTIDGAIYAEPLYVSGLNIPGNGTHNVVIVATQHGSVYAFDADSNAGTNAPPLWHTSFINPASGVTPITPADVNNCFNIPYEECIDDTPAIDLNGGVIYVEALTREVVSGVVTYYHRLHALNILTGAELGSSPVIIQGSVPGTGAGGNGTTIPFTPILHECRSGLLLQNGLVYVCYSSFGDIGNYHGWVFAYNAQTLQQAGIFCDTPNGSQGGIWQGGDGMTADGSNNVFCMTGNGTFGTNYSSVNQYNLSSSFVKFTGTNSLTLTDYFTPYNNASLSSADLDIAAGGPMVLPDSVGSAAHPHLMMGTGKNGTMYILDRDNLGHFNAANDNQIVQELPGAVGVPWNYPVPAFFNNTIFYQGNGSGLQAFQISNATVNATPVATSSVIFGAPGGTPSVSANGTNNAIVWALETDDWASSGNATLHAYNATNLVEIYNSNLNPGRDAPGAALKWTVPTIANGKVYVGEDYGLSVYGNGVFVATPIISPDGGTFTNSQTVTLTDATPGAEMYYTLDGTTPTTNSFLYTAPFVLNNSATVTTFATAPGAVNSGMASATFVNTSAAGTGTGLTGQYWTNTSSTAFTNVSFNTPPTLTRVDPTINFNWGTTPPSPNIGLSNYCVRWTGTVQPQFSETYMFYATADDGVRVFINGQPLINGWVVEAATTYSNSITLKAQQLYNIEMDYFQGGGGAVAELQWSSPSTPIAVVPQTQLYPYTNPPPAVVVLSPTNNASYTATASVTFDATAAAQYNSIDHVSFYSGGSLIGSISNAPYVFTATGLGAGSYNFTAAAIDGSGLSSTSAPVNVTINPGSGLPYGLTNRGTSPAFYNMPGVYSGPLPAELSQTGVFTNTPNMNPAPGLIPYAPNTPLWSDNAVKTRYVGVPYNGGLTIPGQQIGYAPTGTWSFPGGTVFVKTFSLNVNETNANVPLHRLETRLLVRDTNGAVYGVTYKWRPDNSDADLMSNSLSENILITNAAGVRTQTWYYPSPADCLTCHTPVANYVLGLSTRQLNGSFTYTNTGVTDNQLRVLNQLGLLNPAIDESTITNLDQMVSVTNVNAPLVTRVRSYIDANCAQCHQPGGPGPSFDARFDTPLANQNLINGAVIANLGVDNAHVVTPDDIWRSMLYQRADSLAAGVKMPPLARNLIDTNAMAVMAAWINSLPGIPALAPPTLVPDGGEFAGPVTVTVVPPDPNATIYYTLDGSLPTTNSLEYSGTFVLKSNATVTANAFENNYTNSIAVSGLFTIVPIQFISPPAFSGGVLNFKLSAATNETYILQASSNLVNWTSITTNTPSSTPFFLSDPNASSFPTRFYRVVLQP